MTKGAKGSFASPFALTIKSLSGSSGWKFSRKKLFTLNNNDSDAINSFMSKWSALCSPSKYHTSCIFIPSPPAFAFLEAENLSLTVDLNMPSCENKSPSNTRLLFAVYSAQLDKRSIRLLFLAFKAPPQPVKNSSLCFHRRKHRQQKSA